MRVEERKGRVVEGWNNGDLPSDSSALPVVGSFDSMVLCKKYVSLHSWSI